MHKAGGTAQARIEWASGWRIPVISALVVTASLTHLNTFGVFLPAIQAENGWSRSAISAGLLIVSTMSILAAPFVGILIDRVGSRRVGLPGIVIYTLGIGLLGLTGHSILNWLAIWCVIGVGTVLSKFTVWAAAISKHFDQGRGMALAVALSGSSLASLAMPLIATFMLENFGWRQGYIYIALMDAAICIPAVALFFFEPGRNEVPNEQAVSAETAHKPETGLTFAQAIRTTRFARLMLAAVLVFTPLTAMNVHFIPILTGDGFLPGTAAIMASAIGVASLAGQMTSGWLLDRYEGARIAAAYICLPVLASSAILLGGHDPLFAAAAAFLVGLVVGSSLEAMAYLCSRYFGLRHYGAIFGTLVGMISFSAGLGSFLGGAFFDYFGTYRPLLLWSIPCFALAAMLVCFLGPYPDFAVGQSSDKD